MREYQQQAIEPGFLHHRYLRGTAPHDFAERGSTMAAAAGAASLRAVSAVRRRRVAFPGGATGRGPCERPAVLLGDDFSAEMVTALVRLRGARRAALPLDVPGAASTARCAVRWPTSSRTTCCPG